MKNEIRNPLRRSFQILRYLLSSREDTIGVRKMAAELEMAPSSVHRLLAGLVEEGLVRRRDDSGLYSLGLEIIRLAHLGADKRLAWNAAHRVQHGFVMDVAFDELALHHFRASLQHVAHHPLRCQCGVATRSATAVFSERASVASRSA